MANGQPKNNKNKLVQDLLKKSGAKAYGEKEAQGVLDYYEGDVDQVISEILTRSGKEVGDETIGEIKDYYGITQESADTAAQEPKTPHSTMVQFFRFLDKREFKKAHLLTFNSSWGNYEQFLSREKGWGKLTSLNVNSIRKVDQESDYGSEVFYCRYETYENYECFNQTVLG
jgi:hypothetical protein